MRTTLKRGVGRGATFGGDGREALPPPATNAVHYYRQPVPPPRSRRRLLGRILRRSLIAALVVVSGVAGGLYLYGHETLNQLAAHSSGGIAASKDKNLHAVASPSAPATALVIGYDMRKGADASGQQSRSDTIMLVRADPTNNTLSLLSFPRDLQVAIYCDGAELPVAHDRINSAWGICKQRQRSVLDTVARLTGLSINYLITVNFHGFKLLVNKMSGVYVDVDHRYINTVGGPGGFARIDLHPGYQKLDGQQALDFVRFRHTDSDLYRNARQQMFLEALKDRLATSLSLFQLPSLIGAMTGSLEVVKPGAGAPSINEIQSYAGLTYRLPPGHIFRNTIANVVSCGYLNAEVCAQPPDIAAAVDSFQHPDVTLPTRANNAALGRKTHSKKTPALKPSQISTLVLNGTTTAGLARDTSYKLALAGFRTMQLPSAMKANAPSTTQASFIYYDPAHPNAKQAAKQLQAALGPHTLTGPMTPEIALFAQQASNPLTVAVLGSGFSGQITSPHAPITPTLHHTAPAISNDNDTSASLLRPARRKVPFPLYAPQAIASGSQFTSLEPLRVFTPAPHSYEAVLTYVTGADNVYWQVIQTDWNDAPILRKPTGKYKLKDGRTVDLYTNGGNIHMVVLRQGRASYWVVNTLRDELSNETMLAIAKSLTPIGR
jgi:LCP family protein required for cell wall assembly